MPVLSTVTLFGMHPRCDPIDMDLQTSDLGSGRFWWNL